MSNKSSKVTKQSMIHFRFILWGKGLHFFYKKTPPPHFTSCPRACQRNSDNVDCTNKPIYDSRLNTKYRHRYTADMPTEYIATYGLLRPVAYNEAP